MRLKWLLRRLDALRAFLQSNRKSLTQNIAIPPKELGEEEGMVYLLLLVLYGLRGAPKAWWLTFRDALIKVGFTQCRNDPAMFILRDKKIQRKKYMGGYTYM